jgi:hypothetical protein
VLKTDEEFGAQKGNYFAPINCTTGCKINAHSVCPFSNQTNVMIRKLHSGQYRLYSRKVNPKTGRRRNLGTFDSLEGAKKHEQEIHYFKQH